ncbi:MAG: HIT family protein [Phycisphaerales bacterium]
MPCELCTTLAQSRAGGDPSHIADLAESTLILSAPQGCPGWSVLILNGHHEHLESLDPARRARLFEDLMRAAAAIRTAFPEVTRLNYACLCNQVPHLHWHLIPRRPADPPGAVWSWPEDQQRGRSAAAARDAAVEAIREAFRVGRPERRP